jgi:hypothetical protein
MDKWRLQRLYEVEHREEIEREKNAIYLGTYFTALKEDGSVFVWNPTWQDEPEHKEFIIDIIIKEMSKVGLITRIEVAEKHMQFLNHMIACDDHDLSMATFLVSSTGTSAGYDYYGNEQVHKAIDNTITKIRNWVDTMWGGE